MMLPVCKPSILSYLHHANSLCVSETDPRARHYLINYFLQLYSGAGDEGLIDFYACDGMYPRYPFIHRAWLPTHTLVSMTGDLVDQVCGMIDAGCYADALLDEYYLTAHLSHGQQHFLHQNLIFGYSKPARHFLAMGFDRQLRYDKLTIPFDEFRAALGKDAGLAVVSRTDFTEHNNSTAYSPLLIRTYLTDFLLARNSFLSYRPASGIFGVATYEAAIRSVEQHHGERLDIRPWCVFYEHKDKLLALHAYLVQEQQAVFAPAVVEELQQLRDDFLALRNYMLEAAMHGKVVKVSALRANMEAITATEGMVIHALIAALDSSAEALAVAGASNAL